MIVQKADVLTQFYTVALRLDIFNFIVCLEAFKLDKLNVSCHVANFRLKKYA